MLVKVLYVKKTKDYRMIKINRPITLKNSVILHLFLSNINIKMIPFQFL